MSLSCIIIFQTVDDQKDHRLDPESHETVNIYIYICVCVCVCVCVCHYLYGVNSPYVVLLPFLNPIAVVFAIK
jgi:hypothetical protein